MSSEAHPTETPDVMSESAGVERLNDESPAAVGTAQDQAPDDQATPSSATPSNGGRDEKAAAARIRIGSQRWQTPRAPDVRPHPAPTTPIRLATAPPAPAPTATNEAAVPNAEESQPATTSAAAPAQEQDRAAVPVATTVPTPAAPAVTAQSPVSPLSREKSLPMPPPRAPKVEPPNRRSQLTPELEQEFEAALGGLSLDDVLSSAQASPAPADLEPESRHEARVVAVHRDNVFVDLGANRQGVVPLRMFAEPPATGKTLAVQVGRYNAEEGLYELALPGAALDIGDWSELRDGVTVDALVTGHNKGGLECEVNHIRGFIPASQVSLYRVEDLAQFVGQKLLCIVTEANPERRNLVLSHRATLERERAEAKQNLLAQLEPGQMREGIVRSLQDFGAFVDLGGVDGLIHISQMSWDRVKHPSDVVEVGQKVQVKVHKIDPTTGKISLTLRDTTESPWAKVAQNYPTRSKVSGVVSRIMDFGAFVKLEPGVEGLVHISELSYKRVFRVSDVVTEGQPVEVLVLSVDPEQQRIGLSLKALESRPDPKPKVEEPEEEPVSQTQAKKKPGKPLKGGIGGNSGGQHFGLKW